MRTAAIALLALVSPLQAWAQTVELTLNCQYDSSFDVLKNEYGKSSGSFSAVVRMQTLDGRPSATIEATTYPCFEYEGSFSELEVSGNCIGGSTEKKILTKLKIDRVSGNFEHEQMLEKSLVHYYGRCTPAKKMF